MKIEFVYGSGGGNTELVCHLMAEKMAKFATSILHRAKITKWNDLGEADIYVLASPTYGHGQLEKYMKKFVESYVSDQFQILGRKFLIIGLGDKKYDEDYFIESAKILEDFVESKGGKLLLPSFKVGGCVFGNLEDRVEDYVRELKRAYVK